MEMSLGIRGRSAIAGGEGVVESQMLRDELLLSKGEVNGVRISFHFFLANVK